MFIKGAKAQTWIVGKWLADGRLEIIGTRDTEEEALSICENESYMIILVNYYSVKGE